MLRVIIGQGTAAEVYQRTAPVGEYETVVLGPRGLWATLPPTHQMGQPPHLLALPGQPVPAFQSATGKTATGLKQFLDVNTYQKRLLELADDNAKRTGRAEYPSCRVTGIERADDRDKIRVKVIEPSEPTLAGFDADQVVIATGIGPQKTLETARIKVVGTPATNLAYKQLEEGIDYLTHPEQCGDVVVVYGGGATGAWVAAEVAAHAKEMAWMARIGGEGFKGSMLPGDRNYQVLEQTKNYQLRCDIVQVECQPAETFSTGESQFQSHPRVRLTLQDQEKLNIPIYVDQLIYCIGGDPAAEGSISALLSDDLVHQLEPLEDQNRMISDGKGTLAWATPKRDLIIIGSATYNFQEPFFKKEKQPAPMAMLPHNAQVADGIAMAVASIEALNQYMPATPLRSATYRTPGGQDRVHEVGFKWDINFNTSNPTQLAAYLAQTTDLDPFAANLAVALIVHLRSREKNTFGLNDNQVKYVIDSANTVTDDLRRLFPDFDKTRLTRDKTYGADWFIELYVDLLTTREYWKTWWSKQGINC